MRLAGVATAVLILAASGGCSAGSARTPGPTAGAGPARSQFLDRTRPLLPGVSDRDLQDLAIYVCDQISTNLDGDDTTELAVQRSAPVEVSPADANDFMQAAVRWECSYLYDAGDFVHPHKYTY